MREKFPAQTTGLRLSELAKLLPTFATRVRSNQRNGYWVVRKGVD
jgi:hypothetical protein